MIAFVCKFYGWSYQDCMKLPLKSFLAFYSEGVKIEAVQYREQLDIAIVPAMQLEYYKLLRKKYNSIIYNKEKKLPEKPASMCIAADSDDASHVLKGLFGSVKRGMGYGG